jgi:hypothetical protein
MGVEQIFAKERERYVRFLLETLREIKSREAAVGELLISLNSDATPYPYRYLRVDVMSRSSGGAPVPHEARLAPDPAFESKGFDFGTFTLEVYPFTWNSIQILFDRPITNQRQLDGWIQRWLDVEEKNPEDPSGLACAIHSFTPVEHQGEWWYLTADFGSAPADALVEFVELMAHQGMTRIVITSGEATAHQPDR